MKSKEEHRALLNAVRKLREVGEQLGPPHMKPLKGDSAVALRELRPRQGQSDWRAIYRRVGMQTYDRDTEQLAKGHQGSR